MKRYQIVSAAICGVAVCAVALIWFFSKTEASVGPSATPGAGVERTAVESRAQVQPAAMQESIFEEPDAGDMALDEETGRQVIVARLHELFGKHISHPRIQLQAIEKLIRYLKERYPDDWQGHVFEYLSAAFPEYATELNDKYLKFIGLKDWIRDSYTMLISMDEEARKSMIWEKREQYFGNDAETIWEMERKAEQVAQSLGEINRRTEAPFNEKVSSYETTLDDIYGRQAEAYKQVHQQKVMDRFLALESVQADLRQMTAEDRKANLELFRTAMGLDDTALDRWSQLDTARDQRWEKGQAYMQARQQVLSTSGGDRDSDLDRLRQDYFGAEAEIIKQEEQVGLFRFDKQRVYGKN